VLGFAPRSREWKASKRPDERSPLSVARALHAAIPRSTLTLMLGLGHECYLESAEPFAAEIRNFLATIAS
jgi:pimeloyl-ACP methyl ester carboxylesterase